jgi:SAM-dependent methyltransferase/uncharacterized protein YbaR (Trm112 family)
MKLSLLQILRCPYCHGELAISHETRRQGEVLLDGVLACNGCRHRFPVVAGIAIIVAEHEYIDVKAETRAASLFRGPSSREVIKLLQAGAWQEAFAVLINPPTAKLALPLIDSLAKVPGVKGVASYARWKTATLAAPHWRRRFLRDLAALGERATAMQVLKLYYDGWYKQELLNYFMNRFAQPRHLVALSLASVLTQQRGPVLDLACGVGHLTHYLSSPPHSLPVVGLDRNFFQLYIARNYVAPSADFVCCSADGPLPFAAAAFGGILCSDAFHLFLERKRCATEMQRVVAADGTIVVTRVGNLAVKPNEGYELPAAGYQDLFAPMAQAMVTEGTILQRYLHRLGPVLSSSAPDTELQQSKWLSIVATNEPRVLREHGEFAAWPHGCGRLQVNPLYAGTPDEQGVTYRFRFPSQHYAKEDQALRSYAPDEIRLSRSALDSMHAPQPAPEIGELIRQCAIVGMPERYL